jgi:hypothetical protein
MFKPDDLQYVRMFYVWPFVVGATTFYAVRLFLAWAAGGVGLVRRDIATASLFGVLGGMIARRISETWNDDEAHWLAFTLGLVFLAVVLIGSAMILAYYDIDQADRRGRW